MRMSKKTPPNSLASRTLLLLFFFLTPHGLIFIIVPSEDDVMEWMTMVFAGHRHPTPLFLCFMLSLKNVISLESTLVYSDHIFRIHHSAPRNSKVFIATS